MISCDPNPEPQQSTFAQLVAGHETEYPVLVRALQESCPAGSYKVEWTVDHSGICETWSNYTQIVRYPYDRAFEEGSDRVGEPDEPSETQKHKLLTAVEQTLIHGVPSYITGRRTCGGYRYYLGGDLHATDAVVLRPLREPFLGVTTHDLVDAEGKIRDPWDDVPDLQWRKRDWPIIEWLAEFSLQVIPAGHPRPGGYDRGRLVAA